MPPAPHSILPAELAPGEPIDLTVEIEHEALMGDELTQRQANATATIATLGDTPFEESGEEVEHHKIVATEVFKKPAQWAPPQPILQNSVVLLDPRIADCQQFLQSAAHRGIFVTAVLPKPNTTGKKILFNPTAQSLLEIGVHQVYEPPVGQKFDVCECANHLKTIESQQNLRFLGVIPLRERAVNYSDVLAAMLGLTVHNDLGLCSDRRDKSLMKQAVANAGLRVAKFARLTAPDGSDVEQAIKDLDLEYPVVVKTPRGMSTMDVYICNSLEEAARRSGEIVRSVGPDGWKTQFSLMEEFLGGDEFAVNIVASPTTPRGVQVTDVWRYDKILSNGTNINRWQDMVDPHSPTYASLVRYAEGVCRAVGIKYGMAHVEVKARYDAEKKRYVDPVMIEVGARLAGGRKAIMAEATVPGWHPFDAMLDAHCGFPIRVPPTFTPSKHARHVYIPSDKAGKVISMKGTDFDRLKTYNAHAMLCEVGQHVAIATSIYSFAGFVWLIGSKEDVEADTESARNGFSVEVETE